MNSVDIAVFSIFFLSVLVGFIKGGIASILSTGSWIVAIIGNHYLFSSIEPFLASKFESKILTFLIGYVGGLFLLLLIASIVNFVILSLLDKFKGNLLDKFIGIIFGGIRGAIIVAVVFLCFESGMKALSGEASRTRDYPEVLLDASTLPLMKKAELQLLQYIPDNFKESLSFKSEEKISEITILNLVRKLSHGIPKDELRDINDAVEQNSQYMSQKAVMVAKVKALWEYRQKNEIEGMSQDDINKIKSIIG